MTSLDRILHQYQRTEFPRLQVCLPSPSLLILIDEIVFLHALNYDWLDGIAFEIHIQGLHGASLPCVTTPHSLSQIVKTFFYFFTPPHLSHRTLESHV